MHRFPERPRRAHRDSALLIVTAVAVMAVVVLGFLLLGGPSEPRNPPPTPPSDLLDATSTVTLADDGDLALVSLAFATDNPSLELAVPRREGLAARFDPRVDNVRVRAGDDVILVQGLIAGETRRVDLPQGTSEVVVEYAASGTYRPTSPELPGRGLVLLTPLTVAEATTDDWTVEVDDPRLLNVACLAASRMTTCANASDGVWVAVPAEGVDVVAQLNLE